MVWSPEQAQSLVSAASLAAPITRSFEVYRQASIVEARLFFGRPAFQIDLATACDGQITARHSLGNDAA
jgi:hypothetical protein